MNSLAISPIHQQDWLEQEEIFGDLLVRRHSMSLRQKKVLQSPHWAEGIAGLAVSLTIVPAMAVMG